MDKTIKYEVNRRSNERNKISDKNTAIENFIKEQKELGN